MKERTANRREVGAARVNTKLRLPLHALLPPPPEKKAASTTTSPICSLGFRGVSGVCQRAALKAQRWTAGDTAKTEGGGGESVCGEAAVLGKAGGAALTRGCRLELRAGSGQDDGSCVHSRW
jgi:hypothetical protein